MKRFFIIATGLAVILFCASCDGGKKDSGQFRIVALSPEVAEIIAALGATDQLVGITKECDFPPELDQIRKVGNFGAVDKEAILALRPDLVFTSGLEQESLGGDLQKMGLKVKRIYPKKLDDLPQMVVQIGDLIQTKREAAALSDSLRSGIAAMRRRTKGPARPRVYLEIYRDPLMSVSDASFVGELIETAGGDNIFSSLERDYARVNAEDIVQARPEIIICFSRDSLESILSRKGWQDLPAIQNRRVYFESDIDPDLIQRASPRVLQGMERLHQLFFPQAPE